jgi:hypothetical protein
MRVLPGILLVAVVTMTMTAARAGQLVFRFRGPGP